jgi:hypothetical protein
VPEHTTLYARLAEIEASIHEYLDPVTQALTGLDVEQPETGSR